MRVQVKFFHNSHLKSRRHEVMETRELGRRAASGTITDIYGSNQPLAILSQIAAENKDEI